MTNMQTIWRYDDIPYKEVERISTGYDCLDLILGRTVLPDGTQKLGLPLGKQSSWSGAKGTGKTRVLSAIVARMNAEGLRVLFVENEVPPYEFKQWVKGTITHPENLWISDSNDVDNIVKQVRQQAPNVLVVDSFSMLKKIKTEDEVETALSKLRQVAEQMNCHQIFVAHQTKAGTVKGPASFGHLVDTEVELSKCETPSIRDLAALFAEKFSCSVDVNIRQLARTEHDKLMPLFQGCFKMLIGKNRFGPSDGYVIFRHRETGGPEFVYSSAMREGK